MSPKAAGRSTTGGRSQAREPLHSQCNPPALCGRMVNLFIRTILRPSFCLCFKPFASLTSQHALEKAAGFGYWSKRRSTAPETGIRAGRNRDYRALLDRHPPHWRLHDAERKVLKWHRRLIASKWNFSSRRIAKPRRPFVPAEIEQWVLQFAREDPAWGYDRIVGALANLDFHTYNQTVGNILKRHGLGAAPERKRSITCAQFIGRHKDMLGATDFFTAEVWACTGLTTFYVMFFIHRPPAGTQSPRTRQYHPLPRPASRLSERDHSIIRAAWRTASTFIIVGPPDSLGAPKHFPLGARYAADLDPSVCTFLAPVTSPSTISTQSPPLPRILASD